VLLQQVFIVADSRPVVNIAIRDRKPDGSLIIPQAPGLGDELPRFAQRAETLVVEVVRRAKLANALGSLGDARPKLMAWRGNFQRRAMACTASRVPMPRLVSR